MKKQYNFYPFDDWCIENIDIDFLSKYWDYEKNTTSPHDIGKGSKSKVWIKCQEKDYHDSYEIVCYSFTGQGARCPYCSSKKVHKIDSFGYKYPQVIELWSDKNQISPFSISYGSSRNIWLKCPEGLHSDYLTKPYRAKDHYFRCPKCSDNKTKSSLQRKAEEFIYKEFGYRMLFEDNCTIRPRSKKNKKNCTMPYDIEIPDLKLIIEVQGEQHYQVTGWSKKHADRYRSTPIEELNEQRERDEIKKHYALNNGYNYLAIPYWFEMSDSYKELIRHKFYTIRYS